MNIINPQHAPYVFRYFILLSTGDMFLHIVQSTLGDALLQDEVFQLMAVTIVLDSCSYFTEAVQEDLVICTVLLIIPENENKWC